MMPADELLMKGFHADRGGLGIVRMADSAAGNMDTCELLACHAYDGEIHL
jgi:hypothetical protein